MKTNSLWRQRIRLILLVLAALSCLPPTQAQSTAARVLGTVADASGAVIPGASVTATNNATGWKTPAASGAQGEYVLFPLPPGIYTIDITNQGMEPLRVEQLELHAGDEVVRNVRMKVGTVSQRVTVLATAGAAVFNTTPSVENDVTEDQIATLPLNGRDYNQLVFLSAGATDFKVTGTTYDLGLVAVNGNRAYGNGYTIDGVPNNSYQNQPQYPVSVDAIAEFKVISGVAPAEYGHAGVNVIVVTKSGTNLYHGSLLEYYRGDTFQARNPFSLTNVLPPFSYHQFGGTIGGPVRLPRYDGHNRTFFFGQYQGLRQDTSGTNVITVPPSVFWQGDFSSLLPRVQVHDPLSSGRPVFPGNIIPDSRLAPTALKMRPLFATANLPGLSNNSVTTPDSTSTADQFDVRVDHLLPHGNYLSARLSYNRNPSYTPGSMGLPNLGSGAQLWNVNGMLGWTAVLNPRTVNELRLGASSNWKSYPFFNSGYPNSDTLGMVGTVPLTSNTIPPYPTIVLQGTDAFTNAVSGSGGAGVMTTFSYNVYNLFEVISTTRGKHQLKAGFEGVETNVNFLYASNGNGQITFNGSTTATSSGYSFADFLLGLPNTTSQVPLPGKLLDRKPEYSFFAQDEWRLTSNLTLNLGFRNESFFPFNEQYNRLSVFSPDNNGTLVVACSNGQLPVSEFTPGVVSKLLNAQGGFKFPVVCGSSLGYNATRLLSVLPWNPSPRAGFSWDPTGHGKWLIRSGYGIFYSDLPTQYAWLTDYLNPPFSSVLNYSQSVVNGVPALTLHAPYGAGGASNPNFFGLSKDMRLANNQQWNLSVARSLGSSTLLTVTYVGNKGTHLYRAIALNQTQTTPTGVLYKPYQSTPFGSGSILDLMSDGNSIYNSLEVEFRRRFSHGLQLQSNWTWAKGLDDVASSVNTTLLDIQNLGRDRANSDYVRRHTITTNGTWEIPLGRRRRFAAELPAWLDGVVGGWRLSAIQRWSTGRYLTPTFTNTGNFSADNRPNVVYGISPNLPSDQRSTQHWFNPNAFSIPPTLDPTTGLAGFGNAGRNIIAGPGLSNVDASLAKMFPIGREGKRVIIIRLDVFNVMNHSNWANPAVNISSVNTVATISGVNASTPNRLAQFAGEFRF